MLVLDVGLAAEEPQTTTTSYRSCISIQNSGNDDIPFVVAHILCPRGIANSAVSCCYCRPERYFSYTLGSGGRSLTPISTSNPSRIEWRNWEWNRVEILCNTVAARVNKIRKRKNKEREVGQYLYRWHDKARQHGRPWPILKGASCCCCCCCLWGGTSIIYFVWCRRIINVGWRM